VEGVRVVVLDAWALMSLMRHEATGPRVAELLDDRSGVMSWVNLGEVAYKRGRTIGLAEAEADVRHFATTITAELPDHRLVFAAARFKAAGGLSYADAFAAATAERHRAPLLTGDPELLALHGQIEVIDLRVS
jgi:predicted nucleic acid-binding protein